MMSRKASWAIIIVFVIAASIAFLYIKKEKKKKEDELDALDEYLDSAGTTTVSGEDSITNVLYNVKPQKNYKVPTADIKEFLSAKTEFYLPNDPKKITSAIAGKTKGEIKSLQLALQQAPYNTDMDKFTKEVLTSLEGFEFDSKTYDSIVNSIKAAR